MNEIIEKLVGFSFLGNTGMDYTITFGLLLIFLVLFKIIQKIVLNKLYTLSNKTVNDLDDTLIGIIKNIKPNFYIFLALYLSLRNLNLSDLATSVVNWVLVIWLTYIVIVSSQRLIDYLFSKKIKKETGNTAQALETLSTIVKSVLWLVGILFILSNMGVNITSVFAGLGIGGIAIALALQNILTDLFSSFAIYFDKPFEVGDFILVGDKIGVVEKIGIKTTRIKALQGEEIVISNQELTSSQIQNFKKLHERRVAFSFGVTYDTPNKKLLKIKDIVSSAFDGISETKFDRCHFYKFEDSSLFYEVVYFVNSPEYNTYMDIQEKINLYIKEQFEKNAISMAFPTRTIHLEK